MLSAQLSEQLPRFDVRGFGLHCLARAAINLGLPINTGWHFNPEEQPRLHYTRVTKTICEIQAGLAAPSKTMLFIRLRIIYFNAFCLSFF